MAKSKVTRVGSGPAPRKMAKSSLVKESDKSGKARVTDLTGRTTRKGSLGKGGRLPNVSAIPE